MAIPKNPNTRKEMYLSSMASGSGNIPEEPITREEMYLAKAIGQNVTTPDPITREEMYLDVIAAGGGGGGGGGVLPSEMFTVIPASDTNTITVQSALTRADSVLLFIFSDNASYDTSKKILRTKFQIDNTKLRVYSNTFATGDEWLWKTDGSTDFWNARSPVELSDGNLTIKCNYGQFQAGATYTIYIVDLEAL